MDLGILMKQFFERIGGKRNFPNSNLRRKTDWIGHILRINCFLHGNIEGQTTGRKGVRRRISAQLLHLLRNRRHWELTEEAEDQKGENDSLSHEHKEEIQVIFHKSTSLLTHHT